MWRITALIILIPVGLVANTAMDAQSAGRLERQKVVGVVTKGDTVRETDRWRTM